MSTFLRRIFGILLALLALAGLIVTIYSLVQVVGSKEKLLVKVESGFALAEDALNTTNLSLDVVDSSLETGKTNISSMRDALLTLSQSIHDAAPILSSLSTLTGRTFPDTITATQASMTTAQTTAKSIEDILNLISRIPLMPGGPYNPEVPLYIALGQVADELGKVQPQLKTMEQDLVESKMDLFSLENDILNISQDLLLVNDNLTQAGKVVSQYRDLAKRLQAQLDSLKSQIPGWITIAVLFVSFILVWIAIFQIDLFIRAIKFIRSKE